MNPLDTTPRRWATALVSDPGGCIFELEGYAAVGRAADALAPLSLEETAPMPHGSELMFLPERSPIVFNLSSGRFETLTENPYRPGERIFPVAAFNSPGYVITRVCAFTEQKGAGHLPLFSYGAAGWHRGGFRTAVIRVDRENRQDLRLMPREKVLAGIRRMRKQMPENRLRKHLETCALVYGCPAGKNFFLERYEAPLPTARTCNARCLGCLSHQDSQTIPVSQNRIDFTPSPEEIAEVALAHIGRVNRAVVSFGQGCEGEPLLAASVILPAIRMIRSRTRKGTINLNTNGSLPQVVAQLIDAGLDSIRISLNSVRKDCYHAYFRPVGYSFPDVLESIDRAIEMGRFVSINYLNSPGFTDTPEERDALAGFLHRYPIRMIQWRNLNYDPVKYWRRMHRAAPSGPPLGMDRLLRDIRHRFPKLVFGYFNPPKERFHRGLLTVSK